jgi:tRNA(Ile)-lysidine synthase
MATTPFDHHSLDGQLAALADAPCWYVGFSGGLDSTVLLHLIERWRREHPGAPPLAAIHINHQLQAGADDWQRHCLRVGEDLQLPVLCLAVDVGLQGEGLEAAARRARYEAFEAQLQAGDVLFLAHHLDDQVETFFLRLLRGAGLQGLAGMPAQRALGEGRLVRPLLQTPRTELEDYAAAQGLHHVEDPSNRQTAADRNFLRLELLPLLGSRWPAYRHTVARASDHLAGAAALLEQTLPCPATVFSSMGDPGFALPELLALPSDLAQAGLRRWLQVAGLPAPDRVALEEFWRQLQASGEQARPRLHCSAFVLERYRDAVYLLPGLQATGGGPPAPAFPVTLAAGASCELADGSRYSLETVAPGEGQGLLLASEDLPGVSLRRGGERCKPAGRGAGATLKKLLQAADIPPWWRDRTPLLYLDGELLAVGDLWLCESSRWRPHGDPGQPLWQPRWQRSTFRLPESGARGHPGRD